ncbi:MAG: nucleotidyltransferase family protein [Pseudomonadota bacterium]
MASLRQHRPELERTGVRHIAVFGSTARGEDGPGSDIDLLVSIAPEAAVGMLELARIARFLETLLGRKVDVVEPDGLRPDRKAAVLKEQVVAF